MIVQKNEMVFPPKSGMEWKMPAPSKINLHSKKRQNSSTSIYNTSIPSEIDEIFHTPLKTKSLLESLFANQRNESLKSVQAIPKTTTVSSPEDQKIKDSGRVEKKVKKDSVTSSNINPEEKRVIKSPSSDFPEPKMKPTYRFLEASRASLIKSHGDNNVKTHNDILHSSFNNKEKLPTEATKKDKKLQKKVLEAAFNSSDNKVVFKVENPDKNEIKTLTREETIKEDPLLLVYFYESQLKFAKTKDFCAQDLKKLDSKK